MRLGSSYLPLSRLDLREILVHPSVEETGKIESRGGRRHEAASHRRRHAVAGGGMLAGELGGKR